jgi:hypothetical protein
VRESGKVQTNIPDERGFFKVVLEKVPSAISKNRMRYGKWPSMQGTKRAPYCIQVLQERERVWQLVFLLTKKAALLGEFVRGAYRVSSKLQWS